MSMNNNVNANDPGNQHFPLEEKVFDIGGVGKDKTETRPPGNISASDSDVAKESAPDLDINCGNDTKIVDKEGIANIEVDDADVAGHKSPGGDKSESLSRTQPETSIPELPPKDGKDSEHKETLVTDPQPDPIEPVPADRKDEPIEIDQPEGDGGSTNEAEQDETQRYGLQSADENDHHFIKYREEDFASDSDIDKWGSDSSGERHTKNMGDVILKSKKGSAEGAVSKKQKCQGSSSEDDGDRPWRGRGSQSHRMSSSEDDSDRSWRGSGNQSRRMVQTKLTIYNSPAKKKKEQQSRNVLPTRLQRGGLGHLKKKWSDKDTLQYRMGYPDKGDNPRERLNLDFYLGKIRSRPDGSYIDEFHNEWWKDYDRLESHHGFIQWLFPIRETGMNWHAQELQPHEAKAIREDKKAFDRFVKSYQMMLNFYGIRLVNRSSGKVAKADNWKGRFRHLNYSMHNYLRITRILKCLGEMGLEHYKYPFLCFMLHEAIVTRELDRTLESCYNYWIGTIKDDTEREKLRTRADRLCRSEKVDDEEKYSSDEDREKGGIRETGKAKRKMRRDEEEEDIDVDY